MKANRDTTTKMTQEGGAKQQPNLKHGNSVCGTMKPVMKEKVSSMSLKKGGGMHRGKI